MKITSITQQKRNIERVNIFIDEVFFVSITKSQLIEFGLFKGKEIDEEEKARLEKASSDSKLLEKVYKFISLRPRSEKEVLDYLIHRRELEEVEALEIIAKLKEKRLIDDYVFTEWYVKNRLEFGIHGENKIRAELIKKGIKELIILENLRKFKTEEGFNEDREKKILEYIEKIKPRIKGKDGREINRKLIQRLLARGFKWEEIKKLLN